MNDPERLTDSLIELGQSLGRFASVKESVLCRIASRDMGIAALPSPWYRTAAAKAAASLAACLAVIVIAWNVFAGNGAQKAFAAAIDSIRQARTFRCREISEHVRDGQVEVFEMVTMFKEPDRERIEYLAGVSEEALGETMVTDYGQRRRLSLRPVTKTAGLADITDQYAVDSNTGELRQTRLNTSTREQILRLAARAVEDLGITELDGESVRMLRSRWEDRVTTVWVSPHTGLPVQIEITWPQRRVLYTAIEIDGELDDALFSVEPPDGYTLWRGGLYKPGRARYSKFCAKIMHLLHLCHVYAQDHEKQFPQALPDLTGQDMTPEALANILSDPDAPDGSPAIHYRVPRLDRDWGKEIVLYEAFDEWPEGGIAVGFVDGHCACIPTQEQFEEMLR